MPKKQTQKVASKAPKRSNAKPQYSPPEYEEEEEYEEELDEEEEEDEEANNSFIDNDIEEEDVGGTAIYRNDDIFKKAAKDMKIKKEKNKQKGKDEDEPYQEEEDKEIKNKDEEMSDNNLNESDIEIGKQFQKKPPKNKKKRRLHKVGGDKEELKRELNNLKDDLDDENKSINNSQNDIRENNEEESQYSNNYERAKRYGKSNEDDFIEHDEIGERRYPKEKKQVGIEQLEKYISEEDKNIVNADYPERLLTRYKLEDLKNLSQEIKEEVEWICEQKNYNDFPNKKKKINTLLEFFKKDFLDIPYIINYKFYLFEHDFQKNELWEIFELDAEYQKLLDLKKKVINNFNTLEPYLNEKIFHNMKEKCIDNAKTIQDLQDMMDYINYNKDKYLPKDVKNDGEFLAPVKKSVVNILYNENLEKYAEQFTLNSNDIASNIELIKNKENLSKLLHPPTPDYSMSDMIQTTDNEIRSKILGNICNLAAREMLCHPYIKEYVYDYLRNICYVSTNPTEEGKNKLDVFNPSFRTKRIRDRPIKTFIDDLFLDVYQREKEKLIEIKLEIKTEPESKKVFKDILFQASNNEQNNNIENNEFGSNIGIKQEKDIMNEENDFNYETSNKNEWYYLRQNIINIFFDLIEKQFLIDIKKELKEKAENYVINQCAENFDKLLMSGPYIVKKNEDEKGSGIRNDSKKNKKSKNAKKNSQDENDMEEETFDETDLKFIDAELPRVIVFVFDPKTGHTYGVALDQNGEKIDLKIFNFNFNNQGNSRQIPQDNDNGLTKEQNACMNFILKNEPNLILIGANDLKCYNIKEKITSITSSEQLVKNYIYTTFGDLSIPQIYANSSISDSQDESSNMYIKQAISLGRYWQSPLHEILQLWSPDISENDCLKIKLHPLQKYVDQKKLMEKMEFRAVKVVNRVGFDLNRGFDYTHLRNSLQFVSGFGPKKAKAFISLLSSSGKPNNREEILSSEGLGMGEKLGKSFINFIKIKTNINDRNANDEYNLLDMTRIPVESYGMTIKLINDVFKKEENNNNKKQKKKEAEKIEEIIRHPDKLNILDINEYINQQRELLKNEYEKFEHIKFTIKLIKEELTHPFQDPRKDKIELNSEQIFNLLINDEDFKKGKITIAKVKYIDEKDHVQCILQNGLSAALWFGHVFDGDVKDVNDKIKAMFKPGTVFEARVNAIDYTKHKADLIIRPSVMSSHYDFIPNVEVYSNFFELTDEDKKNMSYINAHSQKNRKYQPRNIKHDKFRNITYTECCNLLRKRDIGDCFFRPSSLGINNLTLSYKFYKQIICHLDIVESDKIPGENIGRKLRISNETYSSLDEIYKRYVYPCSQLIKESIKSRKFVHCDTKNDFDNLLKEEKKKNSNIINYNFTILKDYPGFIVLGYIPKSNPHYEYIKVKPKGLYFHEQYFSSLEEITNYFKKEYSTQKYRDYISKAGVPTVQYHHNIETNNNNGLNLDELENKYNNNSSRFNNNSNIGGSNFGKKKGLCKICQKPGHFARECPDKGSHYGDKRREGRNNNFIGGKRYRDDKREGKEHGFKKEPYDKGNDFNNFNRDNNDDNWNPKQEKNDNDGWGDSKREDEWGDSKKEDEWGDSKNNNDNDNWNVKKEDSWGGVKKEDDNWGMKKEEDGWGTKKENNGWDENQNNVGGDNGWN